MKREQGVVSYAHNRGLFIFHPLYSTVEEKKRNSVPHRLFCKESFNLMHLQGHCPPPNLPGRLPVCLSVSVCLSVCLFVRPSVRPSVCLSVCLSACVSVCPSVHPSVCLCVCLPAFLPACLPTCLPACLPTFFVSLPNNLLTTSHLHH